VCGVGVCGFFFCGAAVVGVCVCVCVVCVCACVWGVCVRVCARPWAADGAHGGERSGRATAVEVVGRKGSGEARG